MTSSADSVVAQLESLTENVPKDEASRKQLLDAARGLAFALESPGDSIQRICYLPLQLTIARVGNELDLFNILSKSNISEMDTEELAQKTGADAVLLRRLLKYLASFGMVKEVSEDSFAATNITKTLAIPGLQAGVNHNFDTLMPCYQNLPSFLADTKYRNPSDGTNSPFQRGHNTDQHPFVWILGHPSNFNYFVQWMTAQREGMKTWLDVFPFEEKLCRGVDLNTLLFVDIGGGVGHQCEALKIKYPKVPGRIILQDLPQVVAQAKPMEGVETMPHNFWTPQPIKGARAYYMRNIMHDYPDAKCKELLRLTMDAMGKDSVILIDDMILPNQGIHWQAAQLDMAMMASVAAMERSEKQWYALLDSAGLKVVTIYRYTEELSDSVIVAVPK